MSRRSYYSESRRRARSAVSSDGIGNLRPEQLAALRKLNLAERERLAAKYAEPTPLAPAAESTEDDQDA